VTHFGYAEAIRERQEPWISPRERAKANWLEALRLVNEAVAQGRPPKRVEALEQYAQRCEQQFEEVSTGNMSTPLSAAKAALKDRLLKALVAVVDFEDQVEHEVLQPAYIEAEKLRLHREVTAADDAVRQAVDQYRLSVEHEVNALEAKAEASVPASERQALRAEVRTLARDNLNASVYLERAARMLAANQPEMARQYLDVAKIKGRGTDSLPAFALREKVDAAIAEGNPDLKRARDLRAEYATEAAAITRDRWGALGKAGFGISREGAATYQSRSGAIGTSAMSKVAAYMAGERNFPAGDGSNQE